MYQSSLMHAEVWGFFLCEPPSQPLPIRTSCWFLHFWLLGWMEVKTYSRFSFFPFFFSFFLFLSPPPPPPAFFKFLGKKYFCRHWWLTRHPKSCFFKFKSPFSFQREKYSSCGIIHPPSRDSRAFPPWLPPRERGCLWSAPLGSPHPSLVSTWSPSQPGRPDWQVPSAPETSAGETRGLP